MPAVKFIERLDLEQNDSFLNRHYLSADRNRSKLKAAARFHNIAPKGGQRAGIQFIPP